MGLMKLKIVYRFPLLTQLSVQDHWPVSAIGGEFSLETNGDIVQSFVFSFRGQPVAMAPLVEKHQNGPISLSITDRSPHVKIIHSKLKRALSYLQCMFQVDIDLRSMKVEYVPELERERDAIGVYSLDIGIKPSSVQLTFDLVTRALLAAELTSSDPEFVARLSSFARREIAEERYIDSFRYSFMIIESMYGNGKFKSAALSRELTENKEFYCFVQELFGEAETERQMPEADKKFIKSCGAPENLIDILVKKRGHYFHANNKKVAPWHPDQQHEAEALSSVTLALVHKIAFSFAAPIWHNDVIEEYRKRTSAAGVAYMIEIQFKYGVRGEALERSGSLQMKCPATKPTYLVAMEAIKGFMAHFEHESPVGYIKEAVAFGPSGEKIFEVKFLPEAN